ncbi:hypothetical protein Galf_0259 [Gallionella capsiferriformans ES-2]|uniref:Uncharacterized protein n=1 Tax=Gallionella capsiferriformans (strain ES-2) TaxID=395494 RepID=D9SJ28_GALCS|nr:hypothetical protein Galf_0259 [Gallionella capsiferriformans ES-2]
MPMTGVFLLTDIRSVIDLYQTTPAYIVYYSLMQFMVKLECFRWECAADCRNLLY